MKIDTHAHYMAKSFYDAIEAMPGVSRKSDPYGLQLVREGKTIVPLNEKWLDPDDQIREMDRKGFDMRLVSLTTPNLYIFPVKDQAEIGRRVNDETLNYCEKRIDRLRALASLPLGDPDAALKELDRVRGAKSFAGISMGSNVGGVPLSDPRFEPVWARIDELRIPVVEHPMHPVFNAELQDMNLSILIGFMFDTQLMLLRLIMNGVFERYPNFPFLVAHTGAGLMDVLHRARGAHDRNPESSKKMKKPFVEYLKGLYFDTCINDHDVLMSAHRLIGPERMMWGTDYPFVDNDTKQVEGMEISTAQKQAIIGDNAQRIFKL